MFERLKHILVGDTAPSSGLSLTSCFSKAESEIYCRGQGFLDNRVCHYVREHNLLQRLEAHCRAAYGLNEFEYVGSGDNVVVVRHCEKLAIRFRAPEIQDKINTQCVQTAPFICPIWREDEYEGVRINFVPYVPSLKRALDRRAINQSIAVGFIAQLMKAAFEYHPSLWFHDYKNFDYKFEQIGLLADGTPIIIDQGSVIEEDKARALYAERIAKDKEWCRTAEFQESSSWDGEWTDKHGGWKINSMLRPPTHYEFLT